MRRLSFIPGPSKISPAVYADLRQAAESGLLEYSHRSEEFYKISRETVGNLKNLLTIPDDYHLIFIDSASSAWPSIINNTVAKKSAHLVQGAFSRKALEAARLMYKEVYEVTVPDGEQIDFTDLSLPDNIEIITVCFNESSSGVVMQEEELESIRSKFPHPLLAVDVTSIAGAIKLPIEQADLWYFSVQKIFGLPAGMGVLIISPLAYERSLTLEKSGENLAGFWRWSNIIEPQRKVPGQTPQTPNVLAIHLLNEQAKRFIAAGGLIKLEQDTLDKAQRLFALVEKHPRLNFFARNPQHRSPTVIAVSAEKSFLDRVHERAHQAGLVLGTGFGEQRDLMFRLANFPAITNCDIDAVTECLMSLT